MFAGLRSNTTLNVVLLPMLSFRLGDFRDKGW